MHKGFLALTFLGAAAWAAEMPSNRLVTSTHTPTADAPAFGIDFYTGAIYLPPDVTKGEGPFIEDPDAPPDPEEAEQDAAFETRPE